MNNMTFLGEKFSVRFMTNPYFVMIVCFVFLSEIIHLRDASRRIKLVEQTALSLGGKLNIGRHLERQNIFFFSHQNRSINNSNGMENDLLRVFPKFEFTIIIFNFYFTYFENVMKYDATFRRPTITDE